MNFSRKRGQCPAEEAPMFDHRISVFLLLVWLLAKSVTPALMNEPRIPQNPVDSAIGVKPIEVEPETGR